MCPEVRSKELMAQGARRRSQPPCDLLQAAGPRVLEIYARLAQREEHLFGKLLGGEIPRQWRHYPEDDAIDQDRGYQWFYHSHSPEDRPGVNEHGHIHLFARSKLWSRRLRSAGEIEFAKMTGNPGDQVNTRHLLTIGFDAKGVPTTLFTVNSWVTGDLMLSASLTALLLEQMTLETDNEEVDTVIECVVWLYCDEIRELLDKRDQVLFGYGSPGVLKDESLEVLSELAIDTDGKLSGDALELCRH
jgi:hypothetical protein